MIFKKEARKTANRRRQVIFVFFSLFCILFITLFSRVPTLSRVMHLIPLWSFTSHGHGRQILLNIALFIPLGYFLSSIFESTRHPRLWQVIAALATSSGIELTQFLTYRGMLDVDDLVSNVCGAAVGLLIDKAVEKLSRDGRGRQAEKWMPAVLITACFIGCIMVAVPAAKSSIDVKVTKEFQFSVSSVTADKGKIEIDGECFLYDRATPTYTLIIGGSEASTTVEDKKFRATVDQLDEKTEVQVKFKGYPAMPTGIWINGEQIEYVVGEEPVIDGLPETSVLKAWNEEYDTLVYQDGERLFWLIGKEIDKNTEVIYHIHTDEPEKLPERRVQYGFDNRGFRVGAEQAENELEGIEHYRVFEKEIPGNYHVTAIVVGFNTDGTITWDDSFRLY